MTQLPEALHGVAPSTAPEHITPRPSFEELVDSLEDQLIEASDAWRALTVIKRDALDVDTMTEIGELDMAHEEVAPDTNRRDRRGRGGIADFVRRNTELTQVNISLAQGAVTWVKYGNPLQRAAAAAEIAKAKAEYQAHINGIQAQDGPIELHTLKTYIDVTDAYQRAIDADAALLNPVHAWVSTSANSVGELVVWMKGDYAELDGEHLSLAQALARAQHDPSVNSVIDQHLDEIESKPELLRTAFSTVFCGAHEDAVDTSDSDEYTEPSMAVLRFVPRLLSALDIDITTHDLASALASIPITEWPATLRNRLEEEHKASIEHVRSHYNDLLRPYRQPDRHLVFEEARLQRYSAHKQTPERQKKRKKGNSRVTHKTKGPIKETSSELEPAEQITNAFTVVRPHNGDVLQDIPVDEASAAKPVDLLIASEPVQDYLEKYISDPRIATDIREIMESIVRQPRGNGSIKIKADELSLLHPGKSTRKRTSIRELNPKNRSELNNLGELGTDTRIFYSVVPNGDGTESIALLRVAHKNVTLKFGRGVRH